MELVRLNSSNREEKLIDDFDSLIWTERFGSCGDFQLVTGQVQKYLQLLPDQTHIALRDSPVPMIVEAHDIKTPKNGIETLTITGRSFDSILDRRVWWTTADNGLNARSPTRLANDIMGVVCEFGWLNVNDIFEPTKVQFADPDEPADTSTLRLLLASNGNLLSVLQELVSTQYPADPGAGILEHPAHGIRSWRPGVGLVDYSPTACTIQIYKGTDRRDEIVFAADQSQLDDGRYLFSKMGSANVAYGLWSGTVALMFEGAVQPSGLDRRVVLLDASSSGITDPDTLRAQMSTSLSEAAEVAIFDGTVNPDLTTYVYGEDYGLGDTVTIKGRFGLTETARVTEYIRSKNATGTRSYPTLTTITDL